MTKFTMLAAAAVAALAAACAGNQSARTETQSATTSSAPSSSSADTTTPAPADQTQTPASPDQGQATPAPGQQAQTTTPAAPTTFTDDQLQRFAAAAAEIDPISRSVATQTPEQRAASTEQIRQILTRNNLDSDTYNAIAARAQADPALAARIAELHRANQSAG